MAVLLSAVEQLLLALAATETHSHSPDPGNPIDPDIELDIELDIETGRLPAPLAGKVTLAALYRLWDGIDHQLRRRPILPAPRSCAPDQPGDIANTGREVRLPVTDVEILHAAAVALNHPAAGLARRLARIDSHRAAIRALTALLWTLTPIDEPDLESQPARSPAGRSV